MANLMQLEIVTPDKYFIKRDDVVYAGFEALDGGFGIFANHMLLLQHLKTLLLNTGTPIMKNISFIYRAALLKL